MKKKLLFLLITATSVSCYSQIKFEKGYYVNNLNQKIDCLIRNVDWLNNPTEFEYKLSENSQQKNLNIKSVKEFGIYNVSKYIRSDVKIDRSSDDTSNLSETKKPNFIEEKVFLKVLVQGKASLYSYKEKKLNRYFYRVGNSNIDQLVYKKYKVNVNKIATNNTFRQQIANNLKCENIVTKDLKKVDYRKFKLVNIFVKYNQCSNEEQINFEEKKEKDLFNLNLRPGLKNSSLKLINSTSNSLFRNFKTELGFRFGVEGEFIMPFNKNKWALIIEPTYQYFKSEEKVRGNNVKVDYKSIELPIGIRHYFFLNEDSKFFINGSLIVDFNSNSTISLNTSIEDLEIKSASNYALGFGYKYTDKYSLELRYQTDREILRGNVVWNSQYKTLSLILGYSLF